MCGSISVFVCVCFLLCLWDIPVFLHCDLTGLQLSPGSMSPTGYPRSLLSWPGSQTDREDEGGREIIHVCMCDHRSDNIPQSQRHVWQTSVNDVQCMHLQRGGVCIWSWGTLDYTFRSGTARSVGLWPSCCSLQMDRPGTDNSPYECTTQLPRSWNSPPEKTGQWERRRHQIMGIDTTKSHCCNLSV